MSSERRPSGRTFPIAIALAVLCVSTPSTWGQARYEDYELPDRFYITLGGFSQTDISTVLQLDAKTDSGGIAIGTIVALESQFSLENALTTVRLDGWYRFNKRHRIGWTYWQTDREGTRLYDQDDPIHIGDITINPGDTIVTTDDGSLAAVDWSYSFLNTEKYEAWLGTGLNFSSVDTSIQVSVGGGTNMLNEEAKATVPIPTINIGGRWNFGKRWRMIVTQKLFGLKIGDFSGKLENTRVFAEVNFTKNFGLGGGFERYRFEVEANGDEFLGQLDSSYTGFTLYLKGQI